VQEYFGDKLDYFVMGEVERMGSVSDIIDLKTNKVIRLG
jgi:tRNA A37 threonylcarbamoyladenosine synthetase subunit TsaC/SUA5/YrdC